MADPDRRTLPPVIEDLLEKPNAFSFFQIIRLLRLWFGASGGKDFERFLTDSLRVRPHLSLGFPPGDVTDLTVSLPEPEEGKPAAPPRIDVVATFLGLYGAGSPLPTFYTEELLQEAGDDRSVSRDFIDVVNAPFFELLVKAWTKYRLLVKVRDENDDAVLGRLFCLLGLGDPSLRRDFPPAFKALRYIGLFTQFPRSAMSLAALLGDYIGCKRLWIEQCPLRMEPIPEDQRLHLGVENGSLGEDAFLGQEIADRMGTVVVHAPELDAEQFHGLLPHECLFQDVESLIRFHLTAPVNYDLTLTLAPGAAHTAVLGGERWSRLGWNTFLHAGEFASEATVEFPAGTRTHVIDSGCDISSNVLREDQPPRPGGPSDDHRRHEAAA